MLSTRCVIIGAGLAGASTAYHLTRAGFREILILEQEAVIGMHSSGRNAAMIRQVVSEPAIARLAREGAAFLRKGQHRWDKNFSFDQTGSLLLASGESWEALRIDAKQARRAGVLAEEWRKERVLERVRVLEGAPFEGAIWCPTDGVVDVQMLLEGYLRQAEQAGAKLRRAWPVRAIATEDGQVVGVKTPDEEIRAEIVVNAAGAWAGEIGRMAGAAKMPLRPCRRHLFFTGPLSWVARDWPFVWNVTHDLYFRLESGGLLLSPCDQTDHPPGIPPTDPSVETLLGEKISRYLPRLLGIPIQRYWAGLRTLTPDGRFVIGWDSQVKGFFWVAALGGHGVTTSGAVGALAAKLLLAGPGVSEQAFDPARFND